MAKDVNVKVSSGLGCGSAAFLLTLVFITMKLMGYIDWSWWWVISPILAVIVFSILMVVFVLAVAAIMVLLDKNK